VDNPCTLEDSSLCDPVILVNDLVVIPVCLGYNVTMLQDSLELYEGEDKKIDFTPIVYGANWAGNEKGQLVKESQTNETYFYMKDNDESTTNFMELSTSDNAVEWVQDGHIRVHLDGESSVGHAGSRISWELRVEMKNGDFYTLSKGYTDINPSPVGRP